MTCHTRDGFKSSTRLAQHLTGMDRRNVEHLLHGLRSEATGADLPAPEQADIDAWYSDSLNALDKTDLPVTVKDSLARGLLRARFEDPSPTGRDFYVQRLLLDRVKQQQLISTTPGLVTMDPPGSHADQYDLDDDGRPSKIWYASYGSNLYAARLNCYIEGGSPNGGKTTYEGARDKTPVQATIPVALPGTVHYAGESGVWTGGVAFLDTSAAGKSLGRAHLLSASQFDDVVEQESGGGAPPTGVKVDTIATIRTGRTQGSGVYGTLVHVGDYQGAPVMTFTSPFNISQALKGDMVCTADGKMAPASERTRQQVAQRLEKVAEEAAAASENRPPKRVKEDWPVFSNAPSPAYRKMIGGGLTETFGLSEHSRNLYFGGATDSRHSRQPTATEQAA